MRRVRSPLLTAVLLLTIVALAIPAVARGQSPPALPDPKTALLTPADLPAGWTEGECECDGALRALENGLDETALSETCLGELDARAPISRRSADTDLAGGPRGPALSQEITLYAAGEAEQLMAVSRAWLLSRLPCVFEQTNAAGELQQWSMEEISLPGVGDESFAIRLSMESWSQGVEQNVIFLRRGIAVTIIEITGWIEEGLRPGDALVELVARRTDERLIQLLDTP